MSGGVPEVYLVMETLNCLFNVQMVMVQGRSPHEPQFGEEVKAGNIHSGRSLGRSTKEMTVGGEERGVRTSSRLSNILNITQRQKWKPAEESVSGSKWEITLDTPERSSK